VVDNTDIIRKMAELGFAEYESRSYIALLGKNPATAYEIAKKAAIPTSKIYQVLAKLEGKGIIMIFEEESKKLYIPLTPKEFVKRRRDNMENILDSLSRDLEETSEESTVSVIWNLRDYTYLMERSARLIREATESLLISGWGEEAEVLSALITQAEEKGIDIGIVHFGPPKIKAGHIFQHPIADTLVFEKGGRGLTIVSDSKDALMATIFPDNQVEGAFSQNRGFVALAEDYIKHDIYIMKIVKRYNKDLIRRFGENYTLLRDVFNDKENKK
jgi:HTH-type transcriptional regulator, sugar sensing transcriptional regulator